MTELDTTLVIQSALEKYPDTTPRIISDNGSQYISREFKSFVGINGLTHVRTSQYYPQSNGKIERFHYSLKSEAVRPGCPTTKAESVVGNYVDYYNNERLYSAIGCMSVSL